MDLSPTSSAASTASSSSSPTSQSTLQPSHALSATLRRRSVDTGGLNLAVNDHEGSGSGRGYGGWSEYTEALPVSLGVAELVIAMRQQTNSIIDQAYPATSTTFRPSSETDAQREKYIRKLATWHFDASHSPFDEVLTCTALLFELLWTIEGMEEDIGLGFTTVLPFLARVSKIYRSQTSYHNFQHAFDVLQALYCYLYEAGCIPSIEILLDQEQDPVNTDTLPPVDSGKGKGRASPPADVGLPSPRRHKFWRRPRPGGTLLQRALRNQDLFALFVAAIGHDIGHPGVSNAFLKNAKTPLAELFDDTSVLEKLHCTLLLQVMRKHRMGHLLDHLPSLLTHETGFSSVSQTRTRTESDPGVLNRDIHAVPPEQNRVGADLTRSMTPPTPSPPRPMLKKCVSAYHDPSEATSKGTGTEFRSLLVKTILSTDMNVHFQWLLKFEELLHRLDADSKEVNDLGKATEEVDHQTRLLLCQALIKCADISNPSRPPPTCKYWSWSLLAEWAEQAILEQQLSLPVSVTATDDPLKGAEGQISFIGMFTQPLLDITSKVIPEMAVFVKQCEANVAMWQAKIKDLTTARAAFTTSPPDLTLPAGNSNGSSPLSLPTSPPDVTTMFALSLPAALYTPSSEPRQPSWPVSNTSTPPPSMNTQPEMSDVVHVLGRLNGTSSPDSTPPSPRSGASVALPSHQHHSSHTELPQVSIPIVPSVSFSPSASQHARSSSTTASTSPLFSPRSIPTSSSSPRSDVSNGPGPNAVTSSLGLPFRPALRAAYDAHGRSKAMKRLENRASWQGSVTPLSVPATSDWDAEPAFDLTLTTRYADNAS